MLVIKDIGELIPHKDLFKLNLNMHDTICGEIGGDCLVDKVISMSLGDSSHYYIKNTL